MLGAAGTIRGSADEDVSAINSKADAESGAALDSRVEVELVDPLVLLDIVVVDVGDTETALATRGGDGKPVPLDGPVGGFIVTGMLESLEELPLIGGGIEVVAEGFPRGRGIEAQMSAGEQVWAVHLKAPGETPGIEFARISNLLVEGPLAGSCIPLEKVEHALTFGVRDGFQPGSDG